MRAKIIACLDVKDKIVVKGTKFREHEIMGDALALAKRYSEAGTDELVIYDITASSKGETVDPEWIQSIKAVIDVPLCVAGGIASIESAEKLFASGADKISLNSPALASPDLVDQLIARFGADKIVVGIDSYFDDVRNDYFVYTLTGDEATTQETKWRTLDWVKALKEKGVKEIVVNMMNQDGVRDGYDIPQLQKIRAIYDGALVASGGAGALPHFLEAYQEAQVDGTLSASAFHKGIVDIAELKEYLAKAGLEVAGY
ncbi:HisA/HisF-related TIM barrel protein [Ignatzschineria larvae DSM 13226]|uniref:imidazole glycerol-phosphate synthase n=2 Tax=Ignatzschineria larvae TaxID=112009 RepID=A0ABZ3C199_9GAMM|nr:HisA/HisF-related TIM barrel protein [Ignatzschineria larvae]